MLPNGNVTTKYTEGLNRPTEYMSCMSQLVRNYLHIFLMHYDLSQFLDDTLLAFLSQIKNANSNLQLKNFFFMIGVVQHGQKISFVAKGEKF